MRFFHVPCRDLTDGSKRCIIGASKYPEAKNMPIIVDREQIRKDILMAFERCIERKPMLSVSLRDIAAEAGMSHAKLLNYFESKNDLVLAYVRYTREYMSEKCSQWFAAHARADYASNLAYMNAFMDYVANARRTSSARAPRPRPTFSRAMTRRSGSSCRTSFAPGAHLWSSASSASTVRKPACTRPRR